MKQTVDLVIIESQALGAGFNTPAISVAPYQLVSLLGFREVVSNT